MVKGWKSYFNSCNLNIGYNLKGQNEDEKTRIAIENAASIASMLLTTECVISDQPEESNAASAMAGMGGGMPGMM